MTKCDICSILENIGSFKLIYEDEICFSILHENPAVPGHSLVIPKTHAPILEELDDKTVEHIFKIANKISTAAFDSIGAQGTNIIVNNGTGAGQELPHTMINILPRMETDAINLEWPAKKASDSELKTTQSLIRAYSENIFLGKEIAKKEVQTTPPQSVAQDEDEEPDKKTRDDYTIKALKRLP